MRRVLVHQETGILGADPELRILDPAAFARQANDAAAMTLSDFFWVLFRRKKVLA